MEGSSSAENKKESTLKSKAHYLLVLFLLWLIPFCFNSFAEDSLQLRSSIHISSTVSDGDLSLSEIADLAHKEGISVVIFTDRDLMRWEYGLRPLENVIKRKIENNSIFTFGIGKYLAEIEKLRKDFGDMIFITGTESAPFYYWQGSIFKDDLTMYNWHKHILALGLDQPQDYKNLPVAGNPKGLHESFSVVSLWPFLMLAVGILCMQRKKYDYSDYKGRGLGPIARTWRIIGLSLIFLSFLFIFNNWPFFSLKFDQYHGDKGIRPYQNFIDYLNSNGALSFWVNPEAEYYAKVNNIELMTPEHTQDLRETQDYTGFCIFPGGYKQIGKPGGLWDELLLEYCQGSRPRPIWAIAGLSFERGDLKAALKGTQTVVLVLKKNRESVINSLRQGKAYVVRGQKSLDFSLDKFYICNESCSVKGTIGDTIEIDEKVLLHVEADLLGAEDEKFKVSVIKNGKVVKTSLMQAPFLLSYYDDSLLEDKSYYRLEITGKGLHIVTNPVFVVKK